MTALFRKSDRSCVSCSYSCSWWMVDGGFWSSPVHSECVNVSQRGGPYWRRADCRSSTPTWGFCDRRRERERESPRPSRRTRRVALSTNQPANQPTNRVVWALLCVHPLECGVERSSASRLRRPGLLTRQQRVRGGVELGSALQEVELEDEDVAQEDAAEGADERSRRGGGATCGEFSRQWNVPALRGEGEWAW